MRRVYAVIIKEKKKKILLLGKDRLTLPGGEPREGETYRETLERKLKEYSPDAKIRKIKEYKTFRKDDLEAVIFFVKVKSLEIEGSELVGYEDTTRFRFSPIAGEVIKDLFKEKHLNAC
jgi:hypothetical protein